MKLHLYAETNGTFARSKPRLTIAEHLSSPKQINARKGGLKIGCARMYEMNRATRRTAAHIFNWRNTYQVTAKGVTSLDGVRGKKVWRPHVRIWGL